MQGEPAQRVLGADAGRACAKGAWAGADAGEPARKAPGLARGA